MPKYRLQIRLASSNIIEKLSGKTWTPYLAPLVAKAEGDKLCDSLIIILNN